MFLFAHHMAVELFGREFSPARDPPARLRLRRDRAVVGTSAYGTWTLAAKVWNARRARRGV